ncbi:MAG: argininosuccinate lyase [Gammaproteobacteria bacterium]
MTENNSSVNTPSDAAPDPRSSSSTGNQPVNRPEKLWGGRFTEQTDAFVEAFTASVSFDQRLAKEDIQGSLAHAKMLTRAGILSEADWLAVEKGLLQIEKEIEQGRFDWRVDREDVHMNIEARLTELAGDVGKRLHTGRSRNDQVATDLRLYLRHEITALIREIDRYLSGLVALAEREWDAIMPGFTHLQVAQPVTFGHHMLAWAEMMERDRSRLEDCRKRTNQLPLGAAALAGTTFPIDREYTASLLGFDGVCQNSLDAVSDRDFVIEFCAVSSLIMVHLSRMAEELVLWSCPRYAFIDLPDRFCTGSSIMPQKKNPDVPELVRGKSGRVFGHLMGLLTLMKGQPLAYNKDNQEDKEPLFDALDTVKNSLRAFSDMVPAVVLRRDRLRQAALDGYSTATDLADYLVKHGLPFRDAHEVVGLVVSHCVERGIDLADLSLKELRQFNANIQESVFDVLTLEGSVAARNHVGGTAPAQVQQQVQRWRDRLAKRQTENG